MIRPQVLKKQWGEDSSADVIINTGTPRVKHSGADLRPLLGDGVSNGCPI